MYHYYHYDDDDYYYYYLMQWYTPLPFNPFSILEQASLQVHL